MLSYDLIQNQHCATFFKLLWIAATCRNPHSAKRSSTRAGPGTAQRISRSAAYLNARMFMPYSPITSTINHAKLTN